MTLNLHYKRKTIFRILGWSLFLFVFFAAAAFTGCDPAYFFARRSHLTDLAADIIRPDFSYLPKIVAPLFYTLQMSVTGTILGSVLALFAAPAGSVALQFPAFFRRFTRFVTMAMSVCRTSTKSLLSSMPKST